MTAEVARLGLNYLLEIAGLIGISLAVFNLLPIPALDGARAIFVGIEWIRKKPVNPKIEGTIHTIGLIALLVFSVMVDLVKCF
jgi:regulator of sigma E protease